MYNIRCYVLRSLKCTKNDTFVFLTRGTSCFLERICSFFSLVVCKYAVFEEARRKIHLDM